MANPPIVIGPFDNVPAPGSPIRSDWPQDISQVVTDLYALRYQLVKPSDRTALYAAGAIPITVGQPLAASGGSGDAGFITTANNVDWVAQRASTFAFMGWFQFSGGGAGRTEIAVQGIGFTWAFQTVNSPDGSSHSIGVAGVVSVNAGQVWHITCSRAGTGVNISSGQMVYTEIQRF